ncbi:hypothetical protein C8R47DRAFT_1247123 [Mycena vitilis]|nr:hypothetical protein C8R47DRAFT_1247123 [Mycena vitilis]
MPPKSRRAKPKPPANKATKDAEEFSPSIPEDEKARRHRKAQAKYRAKNPEIREKQRIYAAQRRASVKAKRRRWDGPKHTRTRSAEPEPQVEDDSVPDGYSFQDPRARSDLQGGADQERDISEMPVMGTTGSPTPDECLAATALAELAEGEGEGVIHGPENQAGSRDSVLERAMQLSSVESSLMAPYFPPNYALGETPMAVAARAGELPAGVTPLSRLQGLKLHYGHMVELSPVQSAQIYVAELNTGALTPPTDAEAAQWGLRPDTATWGCLTYGQGHAVTVWRTTVCKAIRAERIDREASGASEWRI